MERDCTLACELIHRIQIHKVYLRIQKSYRNLFLQVPLNNLLESYRRLYSLSDLLHEVSQNNPFLEYTPSQDIQQYLEAGISNKPSLKDELYLQLHTTKEKYHETIANYIIESLDSHGFFNYDLSVVLEDLKCTEEEFTDTLHFIQTFEPIGVAAKSSVDALMIQLKEKGYTIHWEHH